MKKIRKFGIILLLSLLFTLPCYAKTIKHNMAETTLTIAPKDKISLKIPGVKVKNVVWKSKNKSIAKVNKSGIVTGLKKGKTKITAKCYKITFTLNIIVENPQTEMKIDKVYNKLVASDENIDIFLYKNKNGNVILKLVSKREETIDLDIENYEVNGVVYGNGYVIPFLYKGLPCYIELALQELGETDRYEYKFTNETINVYSEYWYKDKVTDEQPHKVMNFSIKL